VTANFIWDDKNTAHIGEHGVTPAEAEYVVDHARPPYPRQHGDDKFIVRGQTREGRFIQVIYLPASDAAEVDYRRVDLVAMDESADSFYVIHARPLTAAEKSAHEKRRRRKGQ
jgi:uncharacterized DUF497 family protein